MVDFCIRPQLVSGENPRLRTFELDAVMLIIWAAALYGILVVVIPEFIFRNVTHRGALRQYHGPELWRSLRS